MTDVTNVSSFKDILESAYMISGIVVAIASITGLSQLFLFKRDIRLRNERAAKEQAINFASRYATAFCPLIDRYTLDLMKSDVPFFQGPVQDFTFASLLKDALPETVKRIAIRSWLPALNELNVIASAFVAGVADESLGFLIMGRSFCATVASHYDIIAHARIKTVHPHFENMVQLYKIWSPRLTRAELEIERKQLDSRMAAQTSARIPPIGCD